MSRNPLAGIVMATLLEADPFIESLGLHEIENTPFPLYECGDLILVISGIGKANAAMATMYCGIRFHPEWICNLGAAGATDSSRPLGAIYHIDRVTEYDRPFLQAAEPRIHTPYVLQGFETATIATQDRPVVSADKRREISLHADLVDMEAASVVQACGKLDMRPVLFKFVSDTPAHSSHSDIVEHIERYRASFCQFFSRSIMPVLSTMPLPGSPNC